MRVPVVALLTAVLATGVAGCGVPPESSAREIEPPPGVARALASPTPAVVTSGTTPETLYFVRDDRLVAVVRSVPAEPTLEGVLNQLLAGPTDTERADGLTSALLGPSVIIGVQLAGGQATVELASGLEGTGRTDDFLAFGQLVCTLAARPDVSTVYFVVGRERIGVPRGDGSLSIGPLTPTDYANLIADS